MYVVNPLSIDVGRIYECTKEEGEILIRVYGIPIFGKSDDEEKYYFIKTRALKRILKNIEEEKRRKKEGDNIDDKKT